MKIINTFLMGLLLCTIISCKKSKKSNLHQEEQETEATETTTTSTHPITEFIPNGFQIAKAYGESNTILADLNKDGISDYAVFLVSSKNDEDTGNYENAKDLILAIFEGTINNTYTLRSQTGYLTPNTGSTEIKIINKNIISLIHQSMRHDFELKFRYEDTYNNYMLIGAEYDNYGSADQQGVGDTSTNFITGTRIISLSNWNEETQKRDALPVKRITFNKPLVLLNQINYENAYELISE